MRAYSSSCMSQSRWWLVCHGCVCVCTCLPKVDVIKMLPDLLTFAIKMTSPCALLHNDCGSHSTQTCCLFGNLQVNEAIVSTIALDCALEWEQTLRPLYLHAGNNGGYLRVVKSISYDKVSDSVVILRCVLACLVPGSLRCVCCLVSY